MNDMTGPATGLGICYFSVEVFNLIYAMTDPPRLWLLHVLDHRKEGFVHDPHVRDMAFIYPQYAHNPYWD